MKERRISREVSMQILYQWEQQGLLLRIHEKNPTFIDNIDLISFLSHFLHNFYVRDKTKIDTIFIVELVKGSIYSLVEIDKMIDETSSKWKLSRMDAIDRAILRIACYELAIKGELSARVVINEAVEIAKKYGSEQSPAFINAILDAIKERILNLPQNDDLLSLEK